MRHLTRTELRTYNGKNGAPAYVAHQGKVYDVTRSFQWRNGRHQVLHNAGTDLTESIAEAPHSADLLARFPVVALLRDEP